MTKANDLASLLDANGDVVSSALDNVPASDLVNDTTPQLGGNLTTSGNNINFGDTDAAVFGTGGDLTINHDGSNSYITDSGTGNLYLQASNALIIRSADGGETLASFHDDNLCRLYYDNAIKLATTATGAQINGQLDVKNTAGNVVTGVRATEFGYSSAYQVTQVGDTSGNKSVSIAYDPSTNTSGSFTGNGSEVLFRNGVEFMTPNSGNTGFHNNVLVMKDGNVGIGDNNPTQKLSVNGNIKVDAGFTGYIQGPTGEMLVGEDGSGFYIGTGFGINPAIPFYYGNTGATSSHNFRGTSFNVNTNNALFALTSQTSNVLFHNGVQCIYGSDGGSQLSLWADNSGPTHLAGYTFDIKTGPNNSRTFRGFRQDQTGAVTIGHNAGGPNNGYTTAMDLRYAGGGTEYGIDFLPYANGANALTFWNAAGSVSGAINVGASSTLYNTSSDYRLKTAVTYDWDATSRLKQLKPARFKWIADGDDAVFVDGFLAHECEAVPEAVTGEKDAMRDEEYEVTPAVEATYDDDGNILTEAVPAVMGTRSVPDYQGIDQSKLTPLLTKALIEAVEKIEQLEARIIALETAE